MKWWILPLSLCSLTASFAQNALQKAISLQYEKPDSAILIATQIADSTKDEKLHSNALEVSGIAHWVKGEYANALSDHARALEIRSRIKYGQGIAHSYNNLGLNYHALRDYEKATEHFLKGAKMAEETKDTVLQSYIYSNIGILFEEQKQYEQALEYEAKALELLSRRPASRQLANTLNNIALIYHKIEQPEKARNFALRCLNMRKDLDDRNGIAQALNLLGLISTKEGELGRADSLFNSALTIYDLDQNHWGIAMVRGNLGDNGLVQKTFREALANCQVAYDLSVKHQLEWEESACKCLAEANQQLGNTQKATHYWKRLIAIKDSIYSKNALSDIALQTQRFEHEKQQLLIEEEFERQATLAAAELERQKLLGNASIIIGILSIILFFLLYRNYSNKQRDNELLEAKNQEITTQKEIIQEKNEHITDSIRYAERLQAAILPKQELFERLFADHYILYKPKDIVSGDFYYLEEFNGSIFVAVADCTGHGVPGAMVSMVGYQGLNKAILEEKLTSPAAILQRLSDHVEEAFIKSGGTVRDGMDISLCVIDRKKRTACFAGAHNGLLVITGQSEIPDSIRHDAMENRTLFELKADRRSIGGYSHATTFKDHSFPIIEGDVLTLFSDGFSDQFGGESGRKMSAKRMRELVLKAASSNDFKSLESSLAEWQGKEEQVDDVTLISLVI